MKPSSSRPQGGFSLAEILVAFGVIVPVIMVAIGIFPFSHLLNHQAADLANGWDLARSQLEVARNTQFDAIPPSAQGGSTVDGTEFTWQLTSAAQGVQNPVTLKKISVVVSWKIQQSRKSAPQTKQIQLDSLVVKTQ